MVNRQTDILFDV